MVETVVKTSQEEKEEKEEKENPGCEERAPHRTVADLHLIAGGSKEAVGQEKMAREEGGGGGGSEGEQGGRRAVRQKTGEGRGGRVGQGMEEGGRGEGVDFTALLSCWGPGPPTLQLQS